MGPARPSPSLNAYRDLVSGCRSTSDVSRPSTRSGLGSAQVPPPRLTRCGAANNFRSVTRALPVVLDRCALRPGGMWRVLMVRLFVGAGRRAALGADDRLGGIRPANGRAHVRAPGGRQLQRMAQDLRRVRRRRKAAGVTSSTVWQSARRSERRDHHQRLSEHRAGPLVCRLRRPPGRHAQCRRKRSAAGLVCNRVEVAGFD